jgi:alkylation response protein AidB-like acyl-CoA dehydrogenase
VQLHGAIGMTEEYVLGRYVRYLGAVQTLFGDVPWHLERLAALHDGPT